MPDMHAFVEQQEKLLANLDRWLEKAIEHAAKKKFDPAVLLSARLAPDMFPLLKQIQTCCDGSKFLAARLSGKEAPKHADDEQTLDALRARIQDVRKYLRGFSAADFAGADSKLVALPFQPDKALTGDDYLVEFAVPNGYFHFAMAYAILRHNGVELGKPDFIGSLRLKDR